jgi:uncharacterized membrane protein YoaK (UPF0700 family)
MFQNDQDALYEHQNMFVWFILGFQGGLLNIGGYLAVHRFVSHITGFATLFGEKVLEQDMGKAFGMFLVPIMFLIGVMVSAWFIERQRLLNKLPKYSLIFSMIILNLLFISIAGMSGLLGTFGEEFNFGRDYLLLFVLAFTCGLQNATISSASKSIVRTTHITGPSTDLGIGLIKLWTMWGLNKVIDKKEIFIVWCRLGIILSFILGSVVGAFNFSQFEFMGFLFPMGISLFVAWRLRHRAHLAL